MKAIEKGGGAMQKTITTLEGHKVRISLDGAKTTKLLRNQSGAYEKVIDNEAKIRSY